MKRNGYGTKLARDLKRYTGTRRELAEAVRDGKVEKAKRLTKRAVQLSMQLYGGTTDADKGEPFDDPISDIGR